MFNYYYHGNIRKYVVAFGTMFNNIYINRPNKGGGDRRYRVPLAYAAKEKYVKLVEEFPVLQSDEGHPIVDYSYMPRMSFEIQDIAYDPSRKRNTMNRIFEPSASANTLSYAFAEIPFDIVFALNITTRKMDDGLQILEQILPFFTPEFNITIDLNQFAKKVDIPIIYESYSQDFQYESDLESSMENRILTWTLTFRLKGYLYGPTKNSAIIKKAITQFFDYDNEGRYGAVVVGASGGSGTVVGTGSTAYGYTVQIFDSNATDFDIFGAT